MESNKLCLLTSCEYVSFKLIQLGISSFDFQATLQLINVSCPEFKGTKLAEIPGQVENQNSSETPETFCTSMSNI